MDGPTILKIANILVVLVLSTACHEFAHAWLADRFGDDTPRRAGRMSFNPLVHIHPIFTVALPALLLLATGGNAYMAAAWTPVTPSLMRRPHLHGLLVSLGGPAMNVALALLGFLVLAAGILAFGGLEGMPGRVRAMADLAYLGVQVNLFLAVFNLLPVPPLDGSELVGFLLPPRLRAAWLDLRRHAWMVFAILMFTGVLDELLRPPIAAARDVLQFGLAVVNEIARG